MLQPAARSVRLTCAPPARLHAAELGSCAQPPLRRRRAHCKLACSGERTATTGVRVRPLRTADFATVASLQSSVFYEPRLPFAPPFVDEMLLHPLFRLDVANTLRRKLRYTVLNRRAHARAAWERSVWHAAALLRARGA
jgi:hypothetical protein